MKKKYQKKINSLRRKYIDKKIDDKYCKKIMEYAEKGFEESDKKEIERIEKVFEKRIKKELVKNKKNNY